MFVFNYYGILFWEVFLNIYEGLSKTHVSVNCGLFIINMIECHSSVMKDMSKIDDEYAVDIRSKLAYEIFKQFRDKEFMEK